jgi:hypothetical protein
MLVVSTLFQISCFLYFSKLPVMDFDVQLFDDRSWICRGRNRDHPTNIGKRGLYRGHWRILCRDGRMKTQHVRQFTGGFCATRLPTTISITLPCCLPEYIKLSWHGRTLATTIMWIRDYDASFSIDLHESAIFAGLGWLMSRQALFAIL